MAAHLAGDLDRARVLLDQGLALAREVKSKRHLGWALGDLGELLVSLGDYANARPLLEEGVAVTCEVGDQLGMAWRLLDLGNLLRIQTRGLVTKGFCHQIGAYSGIIRAAVSCRTFPA